VHWSTLDW